MVGTSIVPAVENLARDEILKSMLDHVSEYESKYPTVKINVLKESVLKKVIDTTFDPAVQLRGFLKTFEDTPAFKAEFNILDNATKEQINAFKAGGNWKKSIENGFRFPDVNPNVANILTEQSSSPSPFIRIRDFFLRGFVDVARPLVRLLMALQLNRATATLKAAQATKYAGGPKIYEDDLQKKTMDVRFHSLLLSCIVLTQIGLLRPAFRELGTVCQQQAKIHLCSDHGARNPESGALR